MNRHSKIIVQTPKLRSAEVSQRMSPTTPRSTRFSKSGNENSIASATPPKTSVTGSPKMAKHQSLRNIVTKKHPSRISELKTQTGVIQEDVHDERDKLKSTEAWRKELHKEVEGTKLQHPNCMAKLKTQIGVVQEDLNEKMDRLNSSGAWKNQVQKDEEEAKLQLHAISTGLIGQEQLAQFSAAEEAKLEKLCNTSQESDCTLQSALHAVQKQHTADSAFFSSAMDEIETLKMQLDMVLKLKAANLKQSELARAEIRSLKRDMSATLCTMEKLKIHDKDSNKAEACDTTVDEIQEHLEIAKANFATQSSEGVKHREPSSTAASMQEEYRYSLNLLAREDPQMDDCAKETEHDKIKTIRPSSLEMEVKQLRSAVEVAEIKRQGEQIVNLMQIQSIYEFMESIKSDSGRRVSQLKLELRHAESEIMQLKDLVNKKSVLHIVAERNEELSQEIGVPVAKLLQYESDPELTKSIADVGQLKARLIDKETRLQSALEENELLKNEISKRERQDHKNYEEVIAELEMVKAREQDVMSRIKSGTKETDQSDRRVMKIVEQLNVAQAVHLELDAELNRLRIQSDQWRKAAEAAATAVVTAPDNGRIESLGSSDSEFDLSAAGKFMSSPLSDDLDDESPTRKSIGVMKKIGGLWRKSPKKMGSLQHA